MVILFFAPGSTNSSQLKMEDLGLEDDCYGKLV